MFFVIETQVYGKDGYASSIVTQKATRNEAESEYHRILSAAATSNVYIHGACILTEDALPIMNKSYTHEPEPEPETEENTEEETGI